MPDQCEIVQVMRSSTWNTLCEKREIDENWRHASSDHHGEDVRTHSGLLPHIPRFSASKSRFCTVSCSFSSRNTSQLVCTVARRPPRRPTLGLPAHSIKPRTVTMDSSPPAEAKSGLTIQNKYTFWYMRRSRGGGVVESYEDSIKPLGTFQTVRSGGSWPRAPCCRGRRPWRRRPSRAEMTPPGPLRRHLCARPLSRSLARSPSLHVLVRERVREPRPRPYYSSYINCVTWRKRDIAHACDVFGFDFCVF